MKKLLSIILLIIFSQFQILSVLADSDGEIGISSKKNNTEEGEVKDCFEGLNRGIFAFNQGLDKVIFKPMASIYRTLPIPIKSGVSNSLDNLSNVITIPNNILQGEFAKAGINTGRFVINSTVGILGLIDVASLMGFEEYEKEDYGQTLATYGAGPGCYIVLPVLGPSTARDTISLASNFLGGDAWYNVTVRNDTHYFRDIDYYSSKITGGVDFRAKNYDSIENLKENSIDFYASVKSLYLQNRAQKIANSSVTNKSQDDSEWEEIDNQ